MQNTTQPIDRASLLIEANKLIRDHEDTPRALKRPAWNNVTEVLVFSGEYLDEQGLPTPKSTAVFNMFKYPGAHAFREISPGKTRGTGPRFLFTAAVFVRVATSGVAGDPRFRPRCS